MFNEHLQVIQHLSFRMKKITQANRQEDLNASVSVAFPMIHLALRHTQWPKPPGWNQSCRGLTLKETCEVHMEIWLPAILCSIVKELGELLLLSHC